jgi:effector-binding domain-containing protein
VIRRSIRITLAAIFILISVRGAMAIKEATYTVVEKDNKFEICDYTPHILAETLVEGNLEEAGNKAFRILFRYISGANRLRKKVVMTAPVSQRSQGEKIEMTAPVGQRPVQEKWAVSFMMPSSYTLKTLPEPEDPNITLHKVPARRMAAVRYSGFWSEKNYLRYKSKLESWIQERGFTVVGDPIWARYNSPFTPWFLRRNEILTPIDTHPE